MIKFAWPNILVVAVRRNIIPIVYYFGLRNKLKLPELKSPTPIYYVCVGVWSSPTVRGARPPPCGGFTLTSIDNHRGVLFGGFQPERGIVDDLYMIDFDAMVCFT